MFGESSLDTPSHNRVRRHFMAVVGWIDRAGQVLVLALIFDDAFELMTAAGAHAPESERTTGITNMTDYKGRSVELHLNPWEPQGFTAEFNPNSRGRIEGGKQSSTCAAALPVAFEIAQVEESANADSGRTDFHARGS